MVAALLACVAVAITAPHLLRLERASPGSAALLWLTALALRGLLTVLVAAYALIALPGTALFNAIWHWCWHAMLPLLATHFGLQGHAVGDAAALVPMVALLVSLVSVVLALTRAARSVRRLVATARVGPAGSLLVPDGEVLVAAAGLRHPHVLVSAGALAVLDDEELAASLDHERGHIARRHRYALVAGEICRALARPLPGTDAAARELAFHLERDADRFAVARHHEPAALATAICKAARLQGQVALPGAALSGSVVVRRVEQLLDAPATRSPRTSRPLQALVATMAALVVMLAIALPATAVSAGDGRTTASGERHCAAV
jgi:hypothetical protein